MPDNTGIFLLAGLGALLFLGRGTAGKAEEDNRLQTIMRGAIPSSGGPSTKPAPGFDIQSYIDGLFGDGGLLGGTGTAGEADALAGELASVPKQPAITFFQPRPVVTTGSGVPAITTTAGELITPTTKVQIGGTGGETVTASSLAIIRSEQIAQQQLQYAANVQPRNLAATLAANQIEEARQKKFADDRVKKNIAAQLAARQASVTGSRAKQEVTVFSPKTFAPPIITLPAHIGDFTYLGDDAYELLTEDVSPGADIFVAAETPTVEIGDVDFSSISDDEFVMSAGTASPSPIGDFSYYGSEELDSMDDVYATPAGYYGGSEDE